MRQGEGIHYETMFGDDTVGALDAANGKEYVRMLRRAMGLSGFHQVIEPYVTCLETDEYGLSVGAGCVCIIDNV
jgi:hypothetical protein